MSDSNDKPLAERIMGNEKFTLSPEDQAQIASLVIRADTLNHVRACRAAGDLPLPLPQADFFEVQRWETDLKAWHAVRQPPRLDKEQAEALAEIYLDENPSRVWRVVPFGTGPK